MPSIFGEKYDNALVRHQLFVVHQLKNNKKVPSELVRQVMSFYNSSFVENSLVDGTTRFVMFNFSGKLITPVKFYHNSVEDVQSFFPPEKVFLVSCKKGEMLSMCGSSVFYSASYPGRSFYDFVKVKRKACLYSVGFYERMTGETHEGYLIAEPETLESE